MTTDGSAWSVPESEILTTVRELLAEEREAVLATVVGVEGNAYRRPGAKMVITRDGSDIGSITAGCLEDEVVAIAQDVLDDGHPRIETYDLMEDDDVWGLGVGCNGIIDVLLEPINESVRPMIDAADRGDDIAAVTVLDSKFDSASRGSRAYVRPTGDTLEGELAELPENVIDNVVDAATTLLEQGRGRGTTVEITYDRRSIDVFVDGITTPPELVVLGTGHDVNPVVELATKNGFRVTVVGFRGGTATDERFPHADAVLSTSPANLRDAYDFDENTSVVMMTHNFVDDRLAIDELLATPTPYIGLLGPRDRFEEMLAAFEEEGRSLEPEELERLYTPVGLDLGGGSPYQIATSIVAEVLTTVNDRELQHLTERAGPIHDRVTVSPDE